MTASSSSLLPYVSLSSEKGGTVGPIDANLNDFKGLVSTKASSTIVPEYHFGANLDLFLSFQTLQIRQFDILFDPCPGFRVDSGQVWHQITPLLLGWMLRQVDGQLRNPQADLQELGQAVSLLAEAMDRSGLLPVEPSLSWMPPGYGLRFPDLGDPVEVPASEGRLNGNRKLHQQKLSAVQFYAGVQSGTRVFLLKSVCTATGEIKAGTECVVVSAGLDEYGNQLLTLDSTTGRRLVCGVSARFPLRAICSEDVLAG